MKIHKQYVTPLLIIVVGFGWLLNVQGVIPQVNWVWTAALAVVGILSIAVGGLDRLTAVVGPFLVICSLLSILRQTNRLSVEVEIPLLTIILGVLILAVQIMKLPRSDFLHGDGKKGE